MTPRVAAVIDALPDVGRAAVCMGVFDGVHRGHLALLEATIRAARERGLRSVALVFDPHPDEVIRPGSRVPRLAPLAENLRRLAEAGIDAPVPIRFDAELRKLTAAEFLAAMAPAVEVTALVMSPESAFGRDRAGTPGAMRQRGREAGFDVVEVPRLLVEGDAPISSRRIRDALAIGDVQEANGLLGHPAYLEGAPHGMDGDAGTLRFAYHPAIPAPGRYRVGIRSDAGSSSTSGLLEIGTDGRVELLEGAEHRRGPGAMGIDLFERA